ncbi:tRNA (adenosine(37)-N6)-threonylcarbamoyltransferase complex ATPase subunit type 1 TsaE [Aquamicrobium ahrensii]|uniref:tRNA threonylcarbamoyladenosine biosynthesis protein TsaE n=1 Tax=Aquamicrobium ahrensii TaxID=469551 RepID=A0ABV2KP82_9HYPH
MEASPIEVVLDDEAATRRLGEDLAMAVRPGDVLALQGDLGAGKSTLARALIRALADDAALEVPSPTFTLVQSYDTRFPVHHFDLYRLGSEDELDELGFDEAIADGAALVEWPERAGDRLPATAISVELVHEGEGRCARISGNDETLARIGRSRAMRVFLETAGWGHAQRRHLTGDASARSYETVWLEGEAARILMNSPPLAMGPPVRDGRPYAEIAHTSKTVAAFVAIDRALREAGICAPEIYAQDLDKGFLLIEHLGSTGVLDAERNPIRERYVAAAELLADLHGRQWRDRIEAAPGVIHEVPPFDRDAMLIEVDLLVDWYVPAVTGQPADDNLRARYRREWNAALDRIEGSETTLMQRDYHSPNLIWRAERSGHDRLGLIDFQDALIGPTAYDLASLAMDARATVPRDVEQATVDAYLARRHASGPFDEAAFLEAYALMAAQRNSKILGIFVRLHRRDGKPGYLKHLPRIRDYLRRALAHPALACLRAFYEQQGFLEEREL